MKMIQEKKLRITWNKITNGKCREWARVNSKLLQCYFKSICEFEHPFSFRGCSLFYDTEEVALILHSSGRRVKKWDNFELAILEMKEVYNNKTGGAE